MKVSISKAADMVGITRATLYRHIDKKGISVENDADDNPKIDVAELIRVYGDRVKPDGHSRKEDSNETDDTIQGKQDYTPRSNSDVGVEIEVLRERIDNLQNERQQSREERERERQLLNEQIEMLRGRLIESEQQQKRLTLLLTSNKETPDNRDNEKEMDVMREAVQRLEKQNRRIFQELQEQKKPWWQRRRKQAGRAGEGA